MKKKINSITVIIACVMAAAFFGYTDNYYHSVDPVEATSDTESVDVEKTDFGYFYDGLGTDKCLKVFQ